jgi:uncharacterized Fe-S cluster-containing protein
MKMIKRFYPQYANSKIAAVSPCYSKRREFDVVGIGDYNVTFKSIQQHLDDTGDKIEKYPDIPYDNPPAERAVLFSSPGGLMRTIERYENDVNTHTRKVEGVPDVYHYLAYLGDTLKHKERPLYTLIDCLNCKMGCNGGPGTLNHSKHLDELDSKTESRSRAARKHYGNQSNKLTIFSKHKLEKILDDYWVDGLYVRSYIDRSAIFKQNVIFPSTKEIQEVYQKMHKKTQEDMLNCASCGYNNCEQMAVAIINGLSRVEHCRHFVAVQKKLISERHKIEMKQILDSVYGQVFDEMTKSIDGVGILSKHINETATAVLKSSAAIEEIVKNIQSIHKTLEHNAQTVIKLNSSSMEGKNRILKIGELIASVSTQSDVLIDACRVISNIADETNILGMNAAIEAAHAGETIGKGFAVVAGQIRHLANNSSHQASAIEKSLKDVKTLIDNSSESSAQAQTQFDRIVSLVDAVKNEEISIKDAVETQNEGGREVLDALNEVNQLITKIKDESAALINSGQKVLENINSLKNVPIEG